MGKKNKTLSSMKSDLIVYDVVKGKTAREIEAMPSSKIRQLHRRRFPTLMSYLKYNKGGSVKGTF